MEISMAQNEQTLAIIKPDAVRQNQIGGIIEYCEAGGLEIVAMTMTSLTKEEAEEFYAIHKERPFFRDLVNFMTSGPVVVMVLEGENAVANYRKIMGATDPAKAEEGTIRADFANSIEENAVHGSDSLSNSKTELEFFMKKRSMKPCKRT
jgi:nucleoside-diphosphate kinase